MTETATQQKQRVDDLMTVSNTAAGAAVEHQTVVAAAQANVRRLEEDVAHGEVVDPAELTNARTELGMRQDRQTVLDREAQTAEAAFQAAVKEEQRYEATMLHKAMVEGIAKADADLATAQKAHEDAKVAADKLRKDAVGKLAYLGLPKVDFSGDEDGELMRVIRRKQGPDMMHPMGTLFRIDGKVFSLDGRDYSHLERPSKSEAE
jgi:hypothetical protein